MTVTDGRVRIFRPNHPSKPKNGWVYRYRLVAEKLLGRPLRRSEVVHHRNGIKDDDRPENLEILSQAEHMRRHSKGPKWSRKHDSCVRCLRTDSPPQGHGLCKRCYRHDYYLQNSK